MTGRGIPLATSLVVGPAGARSPARLGAALRQTWIGYRRALDAELRAAGFEPAFPDRRVLRICSKNPAATIADIGRELGISRQGAAKIVAGLRDRGYLTMSPSPTSGREKRLSLTPLALEYLRAHRRAARRIEGRLRRAVGQDCFASLYRLLDALGGPEQPRLAEYLASTSRSLPEPIE